MFCCRRRSLTWLVVVLIALFAFSGHHRASAASPGTATSERGGSYMFQNVYVPPDETVKGDLDVMFGNADVAGTVDGKVNVMFGSLTEEPGSVITGGQDVLFGNGATQLLPWGPAAHAAARQNAHLMTRLAYSVIVLLAFLIFPVRVRTALDRIEHHPGLSAAAGVIALIAAVPIAFVLLISVIGWPLIPVEFIAYFAAVLIGQAALGVLIGRRVYEMVRPHTTPAPMAALILGLVVLSAAEILPVVGWLVTGLVFLVGLGAAVLAFMRDTTFMGPAVPAGPAPGPGNAGRPPISGPPMPI